MDEMAGGFGSGISVPVQHLLDLALQFYQQDRLDEAERVCVDLLKRQPENFSGWYLCGMVAARTGRGDTAAAMVERAIALEPTIPDMHRYLGHLLQSSGRLEQAIACFDRAIACHPHVAVFHAGRGSALDHLQRPRAALASFARAMALQPDDAGILADCAKVLASVGWHDEALAAFDRSVGLRPDDAAAWVGHGHALRELGRHEEALASYEAAAGLQAACPDALLARGETLLQLGRLGQGWPIYIAHRPRPRLDPSAEWSGAQPLAGQVVLLTAGDDLCETLQYFRLAATLTARGARVVLQVQPPLRALLQAGAGDLTVIDDTVAAPPFDLWCELDRLPALLGMTETSIPPSAGISADADLKQLWSFRLPRGRPRIGLAWSDQAAPHTLSLTALRPLLGLDADLICLDAAPTAPDLAELDASGRMLMLGAELGERRDAAAVIDQLDLVISVDCDIAHLAGGLGKPIWLLLPVNPHFRWMVGRDDSPWYPSARLFRQTRASDWAAVVDRVVAELAEPRQTAQAALELGRCWQAKQSGSRA